MEPTTEEVLLVYVSLVLDKTLCYFELLHLVLGTMVHWRNIDMTEGSHGSPIDFFLLYFLHI